MQSPKSPMLTKFSSTMQFSQAESCIYAVKGCVIGKKSPLRSSLAGHTYLRDSRAQSGRGEGEKILNFRMARETNCAGGSYVRISATQYPHGPIRTGCDPCSFIYGLACMHAQSNICLGTSDSSTRRRTAAGAKYVSTTRLPIWY